MAASFGAKIALMIPKGFLDGCTDLNWAVEVGEVVVLDEAIDLGNEAEEGAERVRTVMLEMVVQIFVGFPARV